VEPRGSSASGPRVKSTAANPAARADPRANAKSLHAVGNCANSRAGGCRLRDRADVFSFPTTAGDLAFGVHGFLATGNRRYAGQQFKLTVVTVRQYQRCQGAAGNSPFPFTFPGRFDSSSSPRR